MGNWLKKTIDNISKKGGIFVFLRAQFSSQMASFTDFAVSILLHSLLGVYYVVATAAGAICGGVVNCIINYKWTFKAGDVKKSHVAIKYILVWVGSIGLNTSGTYLVTELLRKWAWLTELLGSDFDDVFIVSKVVVSLIVGFVWNYNMQRLFVYKNRNIKKYFTKKGSESSDM